MDKLERVLAFVAYNMTEPQASSLSGSTPPPGQPSSVTS
jgi:hypothetical protein